MKQYRVKALSVTGRAHKSYKSGEIINENQLQLGMAKILVERGFIEEYTPSMAIPTSFPLVGKIKVAIVTAVWKRPDVFALFAKGIHHLVKNTDIEFDVIIAGSEGETSRQMVEKHGFIYVEMPNEPLASKVNQPVLIAKQLKVDYILCVGSDDIVTPELMKVYESYMRKGIDYIAVTDFYFYDTTSKQAAYWGGYRDARKGHTAGAGRLISARMMDQWGWKPWEIRDSKVLDNSMQTKLRTTPHTSAIFSLKEMGVYALDIKSETNMTPFKLWDNTHFIPVEEIKKHFPYVCAE